MADRTINQLDAGSPAQAGDEVPAWRTGRTPPDIKLTLAQVLAYIQSAISVGWGQISGRPTTLSGYGITDAASDAELAAHGAATTGVHGIADTSALVLTGDSRLDDARTPTAHAHAAADITSGTMAAARLGAGAADSSTFLRGDGQWAVPAGAGGTSDHGALTGLADDDHPQYLTNARGDTRYQPLDSDLTALAGLSTAGYGRSLLTLADAAAGRASLGAAAASHAHAAADVSDSTVAGRALLTAADAAVQRTALGLGSAATADTGTGAVNVPTVAQADARYSRAVAFQTLIDGASVAWDVAAGVSAQLTLGGNRTLSNPSNLQAGASYLLIVRQDNAGGRTLAYGSAYRWPSGAAPILSTAAHAVDILSFVSDGTYLYGAAQRAFA